jgi:hypothetical protein
MKRRSVVIWMVLAVVGLSSLLAACSESEPDVIHVEVGEDVTHAAETAVAQQEPTPSPGPSLVPTATSTPYVMPTRAPEIDGDMVITTVGSIDITLDGFQKRVRFERWRRIYQIALLAEKHGTEQLLDLRDPDNYYVATAFTTLADSNSFGVQVHRIMVIEAIVMREALRRQLEVDPFQFDAKLAEYVNLQVGEGGALPPEFDEVYAEFLEQMAIYTGMNEEEFRRVIRVRTYYGQEQFLFSQDPAALPDASEARVGVEVQDIIISTREQADEITSRLEAGESLRDIAISLGMTPASDAEWRVFRWSDPVVSDEVLDAVATADRGEVVGPILTPQG